MKIKFMDELEFVLDRFGIDKSEICIIGSSVLAIAGIRENHDLDFALFPQARNRILKLYGGQVEVLPSGTINFSDHVQSLLGRYVKIGLLDEEMFEDAYTVKINGYRAARIEVELAQKIERDYEKDRKDLENIGNIYSRIPGVDNGLFEKLKKRKAVIFGAGANAKLAYYCYSLKYELICYVDNDPKLWGTKANGLDICPPDVLRDMDAVIIISSNRYAEEIKKQLFVEFGRKKVITFSMKEELQILGEESLEKSNQNE